MCYRSRVLVACAAILAILAGPLPASGDVTPDEPITLAGQVVGGDLRGGGGNLQVDGLG